MGYAVELYFDPDTTEKLAALSGQVYATCGGIDLAGLGFQPHISLAGYPSLDIDALLPLLSSFAAQTPPLTVKLAAVGVFPTAAGVVYLAPVVTHQLLELHQRFHQRAEAAGQVSDTYYRVGNWIPHCTMAHDLTPEGVLDAVRLCCQSQRFVDCRVVGVGLIEYRPVRTLARYALSSGLKWP